MKTWSSSVSLIPMQKLQALFNDMPTPVAEWSPDGEILYANAAFALLTGYELGSLVGRSFLDVLFPGPLKRQWNTVWDDLAQLKATANHTVQMRIRDGDTRLVAWTTVLKTDPSGALCSVIGLGLNLASYTAALRELLYMASVLEASNGFISPSKEIAAL